MPSYSHTIEVEASPADIFAILEDVARTPEIHRRCTAIETVGSGPISVGQRLRYHYRDGPRTGVMDGRVARYEHLRQVAFQFTDRTTDVTIDFRAEPLGTARTSLTHSVTISDQGPGQAAHPGDHLPAQAAGPSRPGESEAPRRKALRRSGRVQGCGPGRSGGPGAVEASLTRLGPLAPTPGHTAVI